MALWKASQVVLVGSGTCLLHIWGLGSLAIDTVGPTIMCVQW